jgi:hypothetical protein
MEKACHVPVKVTEETGWESADQTILCTSMFISTPGTRETYLTHEVE